MSDRVLTANDGAAESLLPAGDWRPGAIGGVVETGGVASCRQQVLWSVLNTADHGADIGGMTSTQASSWNVGENHGVMYVVLRRICRRCLTDGRGVAGIRSDF